MPFTFSHAAIVLPLSKVSKKWFSTTGLIVGSITPDFEYFLRMEITSEFSHTLIGTLWFNLPIGILLAFIFHIIIKDELIDNLPATLQIRFHQLKESQWIDYFKKNWIMIFISIIIGAYSHILWDAFTHPNTYFVNQLHLNNSLFWLNIPIYKVLQHLSTFWGSLYIIWHIFKMEKMKIPLAVPKKSYWFSVILFSILILLAKTDFNLNLKAYGNLIVSSISAFLLSLIIVSLIKKSA